VCVYARVYVCVCVCMCVYFREMDQKEARQLPPALGIVGEGVREQGHLAPHECYRVSQEAYGMSYNAF
jgi:hypothetical protein